MEFAAVAIAFTAGLAALLISPCAVAIIPTYAAYLVGGQQGDLPRQWLWRVTGSTTLGMLAPLVALALSMVVLGQALVQWVPYLQLAAAAMVAGLGLLLIFNRGPTMGLDPAALVPESWHWGPPFLLGITFGLTVMGCSLPVTLSIMLSILTSPFLEAVAVTGAFGLGMAATLIALAVVAKGVRQQLLDRLTEHMAMLQQGAGVAMIFLAGYLVYFWSTTIY